MKLKIHHQNKEIYLVKLADGKIRRKTSTIPFGYVLDTQDEKHLSPIPEELQALDQALTYAKSCGWRKASQWLLAKTDRYISDEGLKKRSKLGIYLDGNGSQTG